VALKQHEATEDITTVVQAAVRYARLMCLALLIGLAALRIADPAPVEEIRVRTFDTFQRIDPRVKTARRSPLSISTKRAWRNLAIFPGRGPGSLI